MRRETIRAMRTIAVCLLLVACKKSAPVAHDAAPVRDAAVDAKAGPSLREWGALRDAMCRCFDPVCAKGVEAEITKWTASAGSFPVTEAADAQAIGQEIGKCEERAMAGK